MNFKRTLFSVWQEYRGLGLLGGQAHAADLPRILFILLLQTFKIDNSLIRYITTFLPLVAGPLGVYFLFYHHLFREKLDAKTTQFASLLGALFFLLNLNTLQTFFVPFETFTWFYGALPWLLFFTISYISKPSVKGLSTLFLISLIASPAFYVETIYLVFFVSILPFIIEYFYQKRKVITSIKTISAGIFALITPQLYWLFPVILFVISGGGHVAESAKINAISSPQTYYRNLQFANLPDMALMKGYLFNYLDMGAGYKYDYLLSVWRNHLSTPLISLLGYLIFIVVLTGLYYSIKKKFAWTASFMSMLFLCLFFLMGGGLLINSAIPLIGELFRSPFTKFSIPLSLAFAFFFSIGSMFILDLFTFLHNRLTYIFTLFSVAIALLLFMSPAFAGNLVSSNMRLTIPSEYFDLFTYLKSQDTSTRIANFPQYTFWGWNYYDWGYRGSGFLWHGIKQPLLDRAFDVWDKSSEKYYEEISTAIYSNNQSDFERVIDKYSINWVLLDKHIISPDGKTDLGNDILEKFISDSDKFSIAESFNNQIFLYKTKLSQPTQNFLSLTSSSYPDVIPAKAGIHSINSYLPFSTLSLRPNLDWTEKTGYLSTSATIPMPSPVIPSEVGADGTRRGRSHPTPQATLTLPSLTDTENQIPVRLEYQKLSDSINLRITPITPVIFADDKQIDLNPVSSLINIPTSLEESFIIQVNDQHFLLQLPAELSSTSDFFNIATIYLPVSSNFQVALYSVNSSSIYPLTNSLSQANPVQCYTNKPNRKIEKIISPSGISLLGTDVNGCLSVPLPNFSEGSLISYTFTYSSPNLITGNVNISGKDFISSDTSQPLEPSTTPKKAQLFTHASGSDQQLNLVLNAEDTKSIQDITYQDIFVSVHPRIFYTTDSLSYIPKKEIVLDSFPKKIQVSLPITSSQFDVIQTPEQNSLLPEDRNCDQFNDGKTVKIVSEDNILYQSQNAIQCDSLNLKNFTHSLNYLISINSSVRNGLSLTTCLENFSTRRCDIFERLISSNSPQSIITSISNPDEEPGYTLHLFNESIGNITSSNLLKSITIHPIPLNFIKDISITTDSSLRISGSPELKQPPTSESLPKVSSTHPSEFLYTVSIPLQTDPVNARREGDVAISNHQTLSLYQTRSPFWKAVEVSQSDIELHPALLAIKLIFNYPYLTKLSHADEGLWHNSWNLPTLSVTPSNSVIPDLIGNPSGNSNSVSFVIIYLPQYLEFIGLALIPLSFLLIFIFHLFSHKKK